MKNIPLVKLICGMISNKEELFEELIFSLIGYFGEIDFKSEIFVFDKTNYYEKEMGEGLLRQFISFQKLINREKLAEIKEITNELEKKYSSGGSREINLDPGYLAYANLVLASTKDFYHRVYIGRGIFAEVTFYYAKKKYNFLPWTYPDYKTQEYLDAFLEMRKIYGEQIRGKKEENKEHIFMSNSGCNG
ncbi:MAG: DUF4416 family protein [bacterium]|nr:DUF4416 family protein [bacterium]